MKMELEAMIDQMINHGILFDEAMREFEKTFILKILGRHNNNLSRAAEALGIHRNTLSKRLIEYSKNLNRSSYENVRDRAQPKRRIQRQSRIQAGEWKLGNGEWP